MKLFRTVMVLGLFAAAGLGIALAVVIATTPALRSTTVSRARLSRPAASTTPATPVAKAQEAPATPTPPATINALRVRQPQLGPETPSAFASQTSPLRIQPPALAQTPLEAPFEAPPGPAVAQPAPPLAMLAAPEKAAPSSQDVPSGQDAIEYLRKMLEPSSRPAAEAVPTPTPMPNRTVAPPPPAPGNTAPAAAPSRKNRIVRTAPGEGDNHLTIHIQETDIREVLEMLSEQGGLNILAANSVQGKVSASLVDVDIDSALTAILRSTGFVAHREDRFVYVGKPEDFEAMELALDKISTRVYRPNFLSAEELKGLINPLLTPRVGICSVSTPAEVGIAVDDDDAGGDKFAGGDVILVRDFEAVLAQVDQVVSEVDLEPAQVMIDAMILSVKLDDSNKFGVNFQLLRDKNNVKLGWGTPLTDLADLEFKEGGLKFGFLDSSLGAFIDALETIGDTNVIANPRLLVLNKHRANILIGKEEGYVSTTQTETVRTQSIEFLDIGAQLRLRPFISSHGMIRMEVHPELSDGQVREMANFTVPQKDVTKVTTNIMVKDGRTVIIGGLIREQLETTTTQIPYLGSLPLVGPLFRDVDEKNERQEVIILITPRIVHEPQMGQEGAASQCEYERRQAVYAEKMSMLGKRHVARRYVRMAQEAWTAGDRCRALRFAELAVHFDPLNREAIELRSQILNSGAPGANAVLIGAAPTTPLDGEAIAPWLLEGLENPAALNAPVELPADATPPRYKEIQRPRTLP